MKYEINDLKIYDGKRYRKERKVNNNTLNGNGSEKPPLPKIKGA
jgi:hypothetical protein